MSRPALELRFLFVATFSLLMFVPAWAQTMSVIKRDNYPVGLQNPVKRQTPSNRPGGVPPLRAEAVSDLAKPVTIYYRLIEPSPGRKAGSQQNDSEPLSNKPATQTASVPPFAPPADMRPVTIYFHVYAGKPSSGEKKTLTRQASGAVTPPAASPQVAVAPVNSAAVSRPILQSPQKDSVLIEPRPTAVEVPKQQSKTVAIAGESTLEQSPPAKMPATESATATVPENNAKPINGAGATLESSEKAVEAESESITDTGRTSATKASPLNDPVTLNNRGVQLAKEGRYDEAAGLLRGAVNAAPEFAKFHQNLSALYQHMKRTDEAIESARRAAGLAPKDPLVLKQLCGLELSAGNDGAAIECFVKLNGVERLDAEDQTFYGVALVRRGKLIDAIATLEEAVKMRTSSGSLNALGVAYYHNKRYSDSSQAFKQAVEMDPDRPQLRFHLGIAQLADRNREGALSQYKFLKESDPKLAEVLYRALFRDKLIFVGDDIPTSGITRSAKEKP